MNRKVVILISVLLFPSILYVVLATGKHNFLHLQYYGPKEVQTITVDGKEKNDTAYFVVPSFKFINQMGDTVTDKDYKGKIYVADFFFTSCQSICPKMTTQLLQVQKKFEDNDSVLILSHTVNPERDSVSVLAAYAKKVHANNKKWNFVTGDKQKIYDIARNGYFITALKGDGGSEDFIHSETFILVDKEKHIRGIYDGTNTKDISRLVDDIKVLLAEYIVRNQKDQGI